MILTKSRFSSVKKSHALTPFIYLLVAICLFPRSAHAYLDPGTGSYVIQILIGTVLGAGYIVGAYWRKIIDFFHSFRNKERKR